MRTAPTFLIASTGLIASCSHAVKDPSRCIMRTEARVADSTHAAMLSAKSIQQLVFDLKYGDANLTSSYMRQHGYLGWPDRDPNVGAYIVNKDANAGTPLGDPSKGIELACNASWISGTEFKAVDYFDEGSIILSIPTN